MNMDYPDDLVKLVAKRSEGFKLEGFVTGAGPLKPKLMLVGEAPGKNELVDHIPFSGAAGKELLAVMAKVGLDRTNTYITSAVRSRPYKIVERFNKKTDQNETVYPNRTPSKKEVLAHAPILDYELQVVQPTLIATLGNIGLQRLLGGSWSITQSHGRLYTGPILQLNEEKTGYVFSKQTYHVYPLYHPAAIFYNRKLATQIEEDWHSLGPLL